MQVYFREWGYFLPYLQPQAILLKKQAFYLKNKPLQFIFIQLQAKPQGPGHRSTNYCENALSCLAVTILIRSLIGSWCMLNALCMLVLCLCYASAMLVAGCVYILQGIFFLFNYLIICLYGLRVGVCRAWREAARCKMQDARCTLQAVRYTLHVCSVVLRSKYAGYRLII